MNSYALENFIQFCDDMQIAEESYRDIKSYDKIFKKKVELLKVQIMKNDGDYKEQEKLINDLLKILSDYKVAIKELKVTGSDVVIGRIKQVFGVIIGSLGFLVSLTMIGLPVGLPAMIGGMTMVVDGDPVDNKQKILKQLDETEKYFINLKKYLKTNSMATEAVGTIREEKSQLKNDMREAGYGFGQKGRFRKDRSKAIKYLDAQQVNYVKNHFKNEFTLMHKISEEISERLIIIAHKYQKLIGKIEVNTKEISYGERVGYIVTLQETIPNDEPDTDHKYGYAKIVKDITEAIDKIETKYKSKMKTSFITIDKDIDNDLLYAVSVTLDPDKE